MLSREEYVCLHAPSNMNPQLNPNLSEPKYICPICGGNMRKRLNMVLFCVSSPKYSHECEYNKYRYKCDKCGAVDYLTF